MGFMTSDLVQDSASLENARIGRVLVVKWRRGRIPMTLLWLLHIIVLLPLSLVVYMVVPQQCVPVVTVGAPIIWLAMAWLLLRSTRKRVYFGIDGVQERIGQVALRTILYSEARMLTYSVFEQKVRGVAVGMVVVLNLRDAHGRCTGLTAYTKQVTDPGDGGVVSLAYELDIVRDLASAEIARHMYEQLLREGSVTWGSGVRLSSAELQRKPLKGTMVTVPIRHIEVYTSAEEFNVVDSAERRPVAQVPKGRPNAWAGYYLLLRLRDEARRQFAKPSS